MIDRLIKMALKFRMLSIIFLVAVLGAGVYCYKTMPVDAFPDVSPIMVPVFAEAQGLAPEEVERLIAYPIESAMNGLPDVTLIKSTSAFGMAVIYVYFKDSVDMYFARQLVAERLNAAAAQLPPGLEKPALGPISSGLGQVFMYYLKADGKVNTEGKDVNTYLRELNDFVVKYQLQTVPGVTAVLSMGGHVLQYRINADPNKMRKYDITIDDVIEAVNENNRNVGGQYLVLGSEEYLVRGIGLLKNLAGLRKVPVKEFSGTPITVGDIATVEYGNAIRRGVVTRNGEEEIVSGIVMKLYGENTSKVISDLYKKVAQIQKTLPAGVKLVPYYEQSHLVQKATDTVKNALLQGGILVLIVLALFLGNLRSALIVAMSMPFCAGLALVGMKLMGISSNLMSLGGIAVALGMLVDGSIVVTENIMRYLSDPENKDKSVLRLIGVAAHEVGRPIAFALLIITAVFLPLFTLHGVEGKLFKPMAFSICLALLGSIAAATVIAPVLCSFMLKKGIKTRFQLMRNFDSKHYKPMLEIAIKLRWFMYIAVLIAVTLSVIALGRIGKEFMPVLEEGSILVGVTMAPSISLDEAKATVQKLEKIIIKEQPVRETVSRIGRPEAGSHPHPVNFAEVHIELKPYKQWQGFKNKNELLQKLRKELSVYPGIQINFSQPIQNSFDELLSGIKAFFAIKLYGEDLTVLREKSEEIRNAIKDIPGIVDLATEQSFGQPQIQIILNRPKAARFGISGASVMQLIETAVGGGDIDFMYKNTRKYAINFRFISDWRSNIEMLKQLPVKTKSGATIMLGQIAKIKVTEGPVQINREKNHRRWIIQGNISGRALSHVIKDIKKKLDSSVKLPSGYFVEFGGQFENQQRAMKKLGIIVPLVILLIFFLLWATFRSGRHALIVMLNVPLALIGGIIGLLLTGQFLSVAASVGFIALFGIAMQDAVVMVTDFNQLREEGKPLLEAVVEGSVIRFRPVVLTTLTTLFGLAPLLLSHGVGAEIQRPLAAIVVVGLASSTLLTLFLLPAVYYTVEKRFDKK
ncbi:MAG: efflux RND transporter permease subunit [Lentisphaerae bacterium]|nr:efflux RND transporter permease subunit [Lentisphaerota bacterium]MCP4101798.1 efflux RND transporter permease subunit [Lentisphaerota bacterium]